MTVAKRKPPSKKTEATAKPSRISMAQNYKVPEEAICPVDQVTVLGKPMSIEVANDLEEFYSEGEMDLTKQRIRYRINPGIEYNKDTILHEIVHAIDESLALGMSEEQVSQMATGLLGMFLSNPVLTKWLTTNE